MTLIVKMYFIYMAAVLAYAIYKEIDLYKKGLYEPNPFKIKNMKAYNKYSIVAALPVAMGPAFLLKEPYQWLIFLAIFITYTVALVCNANVLSLLMFRKTKENKILKDTLLFDALVAVSVLLMWKYLPRI